MLLQLSTLDHPELDPYRNLNRSNRTRQDKYFVGEGRLVVERMLASKFEMLSVVVGEQVNESFLHLVPDDLAKYQLPQSLVSELVGFEFHSGILGCARRNPVRNIDLENTTFTLPSSTIVVCPYTVLPDNLGSIMRLCAGFGVNAVIVGSRSADPYSRRAIRVSMGTALDLPIVEAEPNQMVPALAELRKQLNFSVLAATGKENARQLPIQRPVKRTRVGQMSNRLAIVLGNESEGVDEEVLSVCDFEISIPMSGRTDSLNVANALAVMLYQFTRVESNS